MPYCEGLGSKCVGTTSGKRVLFSAVDLESVSVLECRGVMLGAKKGYLGGDIPLTPHLHLLPTLRFVPHSLTPSWGSRHWL